MQTSYLSAAERKKGQSSFVLHSAFNGLGFSLLGDTIVYLLALEFSATNLQLGYISSAIYITGLVLPVVPWLLKGRNIRDVLLVSWLVRGFVCLLYGGLFFISDARLGSFLVVAVYSLFCLVRSVGVASSEALQKTLVTPTSTGEFIVRINTAFQTSKLGSQMFNFLYFSVQTLNSLAGIIGLQWLGVAANTVSALKVRKIPCRETIEYRRGEKFSHVLKTAFSSRDTALPFILRWLGLVMLIQAGFFIPFLKKSLGFEANAIFGVTILMSLAAMAGNTLLKPFADRIGSRFLLSVSSTGAMAIFLVLALLPSHVHWSVYFAVGFLLSLFTTLTFVLISRIVIQHIPEQGKMSYSASMNFSSAVWSLLGGILGGVLADLSASDTARFLGDYDLPFYFAAFLGLVIALTSLLANEIGGMTMKEAAQVVFSSRNLKAFLDVYQLSNAPWGPKRQTLLYNIGQSDAPVAAAEVKRMLKNPFLSEKGEMLRLLFASPTPQVLPDIIADALDRGSYTRRDSVFALGAYPGKETEQALLSILDDVDPLIYSNAVKSLARIGYKDGSLIAEINRRFPLEFGFPETILNYIIALYHMDREGEVLSNLFSYEYPEGLAKSVFSLLASLMECLPPLNEVYQAEAEEPSSGFEGFIEETRDLEPFLENGSLLRRWYASGEFHEMRNWALKMVSEYRKQENTFLYHALAGKMSANISNITIIAVIYFTFVLLSRH